MFLRKRQKVQEVLPLILDTTGHRGVASSLPALPLPVSDGLCRVGPPRVRRRALTSRSRIFLLDRSPRENMWDVGRVPKVFLSQSL